MLKFQMSFLGNLCIFGLFLLLRATEIPKKFNNRIVKLFRKNASGTWCLSQSSDSKFEAYSFNVTLKVLLTIRDVTDANSLDVR